MQSGPSTPLRENDPSSGNAAHNTVFAVLLAISFSHLLNDTIQSLIPAIYPLIKNSFHLSFTQVGLITCTFQLTASLLQPFVGTYTDRKPFPYSLPIGMTLTLSGLVLLALAPNFTIILLAAALIGSGSSVFHPEASRVAYMASGGKTGFAQSFFQVGGNTGSSLGPLLAAVIVEPYGQRNVLWFSVVALLGIFVLTKVGGWYSRNMDRIKPKSRVANRDLAEMPLLPRRKVIWSLAVLLVLVFSKYVYLVSLTSYYTFYLIKKFGVSTQSAQIHLFIFLFAVAAGTIIGGPVGDRIGRKPVIWVSILGIAPFTLIVPHVNLYWTTALTALIGAILASAFPAILVYAQELMPGKVGMIAGLFFGLAFGIAGIGAAGLGILADHTSIFFVYKVCAYLPLIGLLTAFLPNLRHEREHALGVR